MTSELVEHYFRREYGKLVAVLSRRTGVQHLETIEDSVQSALMTALESWTRYGLPDKPLAWSCARSRCAWQASWPSIR